jgi:uncharacterized Zn-finger protein
MPNKNFMADAADYAVATHKLALCGIGISGAVANSWHIPVALELEVRERDIACIYCGVAFTAAHVSRRSAASWEHIINDAKIVTRENIALCCCGCNASKGQKQLSIWLQSKYCMARGITSESVAQIAKAAIANGQ